MSTWHETLDLYEQSLQHHRQLIDVEETTEVNPWPPAELPSAPLPDELRARAAALLDESNLLIDDLAAKMASIPTLKPMRRAHQVTPGAARWTTTL